MKKILWLSDSFPPGTGGVQSYLYNTVVNMDGFCSVVICGGYKDKGRECDQIDETIRSKGGEIIRVDYMPDNDGMNTVVKSCPEILKLFNLVLKTVKSKNISLLVFGHATFFNLAVLCLMSFVSAIPLAVVFHGEDIPEIKLKSNFLKRWLIKKADIHICNSDFTRTRLANFCGGLEKTFVAYPGVEDRFFVKVDAGELRKKYGAENKKVILTVGRLDLRKGHDLVIDTLPRLIGRFPDLLYLVGGAGSNIDLLRQKVSMLQLQDHVTFCGFVPEEDIVAFHQLADIFVMPNRVLEDGDTEGFGIVFLEAGAGGKPVIGGACGGAREAVDDGKSGYLVDPASAEELSEKIIYLMSDPEKAGKMGAYGRQRAWDSFRWPWLSSKLGNFLCEALKTPLL